MKDGRRASCADALRLSPAAEDPSEENRRHPCKKQTSYYRRESAILIFCKAPEPGQVKTRLTPPLSAVQAAELHKRLTRLTIERALHSRLRPVQLWCAPDTRHMFFRECAERYPISLYQQQGGDLGERMHHALSAALQNHRHAILTGCDCPSLQPYDLQNAAAALANRCDVVIAPAVDGGYVLIGLNRPQATLFEEMPWGGENIFELTRNRAVIEQLRFNELAVQWDVDVPEDLVRLQTLHRDLLKGLA